MPSFFINASQFFKMKIILVQINCVNAMEGIRAMQYSMRGMKFHEAILFTHEDVQAEGIRVVKIDKLNSVDEYNDKVLRLYEMLSGVEYDFMLLVQDDGFIISPELWDPAFLSYDYIGAPWPNNKEWVEKQTKVNKFMVGDWNRVGNGGFSLRSQKFVKASASFKGCCGLGEDVFLCLVNSDVMKAIGIKFGTVEMALRFSYENPVAEEDYRPFHNGSHFGFHGHQLSNSQELINLKNK